VLADWPTALRALNVAHFIAFVTWWELAICQFLLLLNVAQAFAISSIVTELAKAF